MATNKSNKEEVSKLVVVLLIVAIVLSVVSLAATLSLTTQPLEAEMAHAGDGESSNTGEVKFEVMSNEEDQEEENETS